MDETTLSNSDLIFPASSDQNHLDSDDEENMTPAEVLKELTQAYLNEIAAPKLLPHKYPLVDCLTELMDKIEAILENNTEKRKNKRVHECISQLESSIHRMELCRLSHIVNAYLRTRIIKIEVNPAHILNDNIKRAQKSRLSGQLMELLDEREIAFANGLFKANNDLFHESFLASIPLGLQRVPLQQPNSRESTRVFVEILKDKLGEVAVNDMTDPNSEIIISLEKDSCYLMPYHSIEEHLGDGNVSLL